MSKLTDEQDRELQRLAELPDEEIDTTEIPEIRDFSSAIRGKCYRPIKKQVILQTDADLIAWFKAQAGGIRRGSILLCASMLKSMSVGAAKRKTRVTWQWLPAVREPRQREALPSKA